MRALVTGFEPFGGENTNASREAVLRLPPRVDGIEIATAILPTSYARSIAELDAAIAHARPHIVLCVGQAGDRTALNVERVAINVQDTTLADNDGARPVDRPIVAGGPPACFATLPIKKAVAALQAAGLAAQLSNSAGTFVCNHVFYGLMRLAARKKHRFKAGFLHVPQLSVVTRASGNPAMALADIVRGIEVILRVSAVEAGGN
ncbi:MAG: pyroglutamyl-peptidase I [Betaproteobacteria bacterium]|nr:pyroglutamyl-peptidase I [Betaproteobacteria bacterium]